MPVSSDGLSGGIPLFCSKEVGDSLNNVSDQHIDANVKNVRGFMLSRRFHAFMPKLVGVSVPRVGII